MTHEESWNQNFGLLKAYIEKHHHLPDNKKVENRGFLNMVKYNGKKKLVSESILETMRSAWSLV